MVEIGVPANNCWISSFVTSTSDSPPLINLIVPSSITVLPLTCKGALTEEPLKLPIPILGLLSLPTADNLNTSRAAD